MEIKESRYDRVGEKRERGLCMGLRFRELRWLYTFAIFVYTISVVMFMLDSSIFRTYINLNDLFFIN